MYQAKPSKKNGVTEWPTYECLVPISVGIGDTLEIDPCDPNPKGLIRKFREELERREENIRAVVRAEFVPKDIALVSDKQRKFIVDWCD